MALEREVAEPDLRARTDRSFPILVPARNEAANIERTARAFLAQGYADLELIERRCLHQGFFSVLDTTLNRL